jgi:hypothetical protein
MKTWNTNDSSLNMNVEKDSTDSGGEEGFMKPHRQGRQRTGDTNIH